MGITAGYSSIIYIHTCVITDVGTSLRLIEECSGNSRDTIAFVYTEHPFWLDLIPANRSGACRDRLMTYTNAKF